MAPVFAQFKLDIGAGEVTDTRGNNSPTLDVAVQDTLYCRYVGGSVSTGAAHVQDRRHPNEPWVNLAALALDGTVEEIDIAGSMDIRIAVTTKESSIVGDVYAMARRTEEQ